MFPTSKSTVQYGETVVKTIGFGERKIYAHYFAKVASIRGHSPIAVFEG